MPFYWNLVQETDKKLGSCTCPIRGNLGVEMGCLWGHLTQAQHTRKAFLNRKTQKMSRDETAVGSQETNVKKRIIGKEQSTQKSLETREEASPGQ